MVIIKNGAENSETTIEKGKIKFVDLHSTKIERKYNVGTIMLHIGEIIVSEGIEYKKYYTLESVNNPEDIVRLF